MQLEGARIAVTGATGFVGRSLVATLLARGAHVIGVVRNPDRVPELAERGVELRRADLTSQDSLRSAFDGADAVFSNAAQIAIGQMGLEPLIAINVDGTANVLRAAAESGVRRVVMTSSAASYRSRPDDHYTETDPLLDRDDRVSRFDYYSLSKAIAEREAWRLAEELDLQLTSVRPHQIYGAFDGTGFTLWMKRLMSLPVSVFPTHMRFPSVYVDDLTEGMCRCLERPTSIRRAYNLTGDAEAESYWGMARAYGEAGGKRPWLVIPVPLPLRRSYDLSRARADLEFENRPAIEGFRQMLAQEAAAAHAAHA